MASDDMSFASLIKCVRTQLGLTQEELARELGVSFPTVNRWENRQVNPSRLAQSQFHAFCSKMKRQGKLKLPPASE